MGIVENVVGMIIENAGDMIIENVGGMKIDLMVIAKADLILPTMNDRRSNRGFDDVRRNNNSDDYRRRNNDTGSTGVSSGSRKEESFPPLAPPPTDPAPAPQQQASTAKHAQEKDAPNEKSKEKEETEKAVELKRIQKEEEEKKRQAEELQKQKEDEELLLKFLSLKDNELLDFCKDNESTLGNQIETLTNSLFKEHKDASWTSTHKSALQYLIPPNDMSKQLDVLFAIQKYCHSINFPKENDKNAIHTYFELMLSEDIVSYESFFDWKDDERKAHEKGKMKAIIQTMDWFQFLEDMMARMMKKSIMTKRKNMKMAFKDVTLFLMYCV